MGRFSRLSDQDLDRLLAGNSFGDGEHDELAAFFREMPANLQEAPDEATAARHVSAMVETCHLRTEAARPESKPARAFDSPRRKRLMPSKVFKIVLAGVLALAAFSGAAYAGVLPGGIQAPTSGIAKNVGLSLPSGDEQNNNIDDGQQNNVDNGPQGNVDEGQQGNMDDGPQGNIDDGPQGNVDDGQKGNVDDGPQGNVDDGPQGNVDDGPKGNVDDGPKGNQDQGQQGNDGGSNQSGSGSQGNGNN